MSGLIADSRTLVDKARVDAQNHWFSYNEPMSVESVTQSVSNLAMQFGEEGDDRPMVGYGGRVNRGGGGYTMNGEWGRMFITISLCAQANLLSWIGGRRRCICTF